MFSYERGAPVALNSKPPGSRCCRRPGPTSSGEAFLAKHVATQGQMDGIISQLPFKGCLPEVASVGDWPQICPWVASRVERVANQDHDL